MGPGWFPGLHPKVYPRLGMTLARLLPPARRVPLGF